MVGGLAALLTNLRLGGVIALLVLLAAACAVIFAVSRRNKINHLNVTDSHEVLVLAGAAPSTYANDPRLDPHHKPKKVKKSKLKSAA